MAGMTPAAPFVGAVTTRPPAAFSSLTAMAKRETQSSGGEGGRGVWGELSRARDALVETRSSATNVEAAGQDALGGDAALCAALHGLPEGEDAGADLGFGGLERSPVPCFSGEMWGGEGRAADGGEREALVGFEERTLVGEDELGDGEVGWTRRWRGAQRRLRTGRGTWRGVMDFSLGLGASSPALRMKPPPTE